MIITKNFSVNPLGENCYVVSDDSHEAVIIDCGAFYDEEKAAISDYIDLNELRPVAHLLTHAHFDHLFGAAFIHERYGLAARCHVNELPLFNDTESQMRTILGGHAMPCPTGPAGEALTDDAVIRFGTHELKAIPCPGHSPGGLCFYCEEEHVLFSGDNLFRMSIGRTDLPGGHHWTLIRSLQHLIKQLPPDVTVYPGHGPATDIATERTYNPYLSH